MSNRSGLVYILGYRGVVVHNSGTRCILASKVTSEAAYVYRINLVKWVKYKTNNFIKFGKSKEFTSNLDLV